MDFQDGASVIANLTTIGRKTGQRRTVELRLVSYQGCFYATSTRVEGKHWCQNMLKNPAVALTVKGEFPAFQSKSPMRACGGKS
ncbi:MAG TPA: nitroreductase/quinone reductase family protein [Candidatus Saccharimonadales bacterium]|nr:nitroreductase/quinone reductase family protein [Candidatus Saccharimonadales bacterium]